MVTLIKAVPKRAGACLAAALLALAMGVGICSQAPRAYADGMSADGLVLSSAFAAAENNPEILGITNVGTRRTNVDTGNAIWSSPNFMIWGTDFNSAPNPYMANAVLNYESGTDDAKPSTIEYTRATPAPMAAMKPYGADAASDMVWEQLPDIIVGVAAGGASVDYSEASYAPAVAQATGSAYNPVWMGYVPTDVYTMLDHLYELGTAADKIVADSNGAKRLRYGSAVEIAANYEKYIKGMPGYILEQLEKDGKPQKSLAVVESYDAVSNTYNITPTDCPGSKFAATRIFEATSTVATNIADSMAADGEGNITVTPEQLAQADVIIMGTLAPYQDNEAAVLASLSSDMLQKTYWGGYPNQPVGSTFTTYANSVENAQNHGRLLGCLYPEYVDQDDMICYYYDTFYHIADGKLKEAIDNAMDGVRNWDASGSASELTSWTEDDAATYNKATVQKILDEGCAWLFENADKAPERLALTEHVTIDIAAADVSFDPSSVVYTGQAHTPSPVVKFGDVELTAGTSYEVSYANNVEVGSAKVSIAGAGPFIGEVQSSFTIAPIDIAQATIAPIEDQMETGQPVQPVLTVTMGNKTLVAGTDYRVDYNNNIKSGTAKATLTGIGDFAGALSTTFRILPMPVEEPAWVRLAGSNRYETMAAIAGAAFESCDYAVVATGQNFPDALSASALAGAYRCPVILTRTGELSLQARNQLQALGVKNAFIMGGDAAVAQRAEDAMKTLGIATERVAGSNRYETAQASYEVFAKAKIGQGSSYDTAIVASGVKFPDSLSIGPYAYAKGAPIFLTNKDGKLSAAEVSAINSDASIKRIVVVGGSAVVDLEDVRATVGTERQVVQLAGADRYKTSAEVIRWELREGLGVAHPGVATGKSYPDALAGAALCGSKESVLALADAGKTDAINVLGLYKANIEQGYFFGGTDAVSAELAALVEQATASSS